MKKILLVISLFVLLAAPAWGADCGAGPFYVSSSTGATTNNGTLASPWKHHPWDVLADGNELCTLATGNTVYLKKGDVWWDSAIATAASGVSNESRIITTTIDGFGTGNNPLISSSWDTTGYDSGWTDDGGNVWHRTVSATVNLVVYDGEILVKDTGTSPAANKWFWSSNVLYVNVGGNPASTTKWRVGHRTGALNINNNYVTFRDIDFEAANGIALGGMFVQTGTTGVILDGITYRYALINALSMTAPTSAEVKNCNFSKVKNNDGTMTGAMLYVTSPTTSKFYSNTISGGAKGIEIATGATGVNEIYSNTITGQVLPGGTAIGINLAAGTGYLVYLNTIHSFVAATNDSTTGISLPVGGNRVYQNTIYGLGTGSGGNALGINVASDSNYIYSNVIHDIDYMGIYLNNADLNQVYKNEIYNVGRKTVDGSDWIYYGSGGAGLGIYVVGSSENNDIYRNYAHENYGGITQATTGGAGNNRYFYNLVTNSIVNGMGVGSDGAAENPAIFYNNTIVHNTSANNNPTYRGHALFMQNATVGGGRGVFSNNIIYMLVSGEDTHGVWVQGDDVTTYLTSLKLDYNLIYATIPGAMWAKVLGTAYTTGADYKSGIPTLSAKITGLDGVQASAESHSVITDPLFVNASSGDFRLQNGSPAISTGVYVTGLHDQAGITDFSGQDLYNLPAPDMGAYGTVKATVISGAVF